MMNKNADQAELYYRAGDFRRARRLATELLGESGLEPQERARLEQILRTTGIDSVSVMAILFTLLVFLFLCVRYAL